MRTRIYAAPAVKGLNIFFYIRNNPVPAIHLANILATMSNLRYFRSSGKILCCILSINFKYFYHKMYCKGLWCSKLNILFLSISVVNLLVSFAVTIVLLHYAEILYVMTSIYF